MQIPSEGASAQANDHGSAALTYVVVGAGEAGAAAALAMREQGFAGRIVLVGAERHVPYARPPLSKETLLAPRPVRQPAQPRTLLRAQRIELLLGHEVLAIDPAARRLSLRGTPGHTSLSYDRLLLATGGRARRSGLLDQAGALYLRTYEDALAIRRRLAHGARVVVVGGGVIGLELASSARASGLDVTVIETAARLMQRCLTPEVSRKLQDLHADRGVRLRLGATLQGIRSSGGTFVAELADGSAEGGDVLLAGIGLDPATELAEAAGCDTANGVLVDGDGRTTVDGIFAAGDVARFTHPLFDESLRPETWQHARLHGAHVGRAMAGANAPFCEVPWFWTDQHEVNLQVAGAPHLADQTIARGEDPATWLHLREGRLVGATTLDNGRDMRPCITLIAQARALDPAVLADPHLQLRSLLNHAA